MPVDCVGLDTKFYRSSTIFASVCSTKSFRTDRNPNTFTPPYKTKYRTAALNKNYEELAGANLIAFQKGKLRCPTNRCGEHDAEFCSIERTWRRTSHRCSLMWGADCGDDASVDVEDLRSQLRMMELGIGSTSTAKKARSKEIHWDRSCSARRCSRCCSE